MSVCGLRLVIGVLLVMRPVEVLRRLEGSAFSEDSVNALLSEMRRAGSLSVGADLLDARRKIYVLRPPQKPDLLPKEDLTRADLKALMKRAADLNRTCVDTCSTQHLNTL